MQPRETDSIYRISTSIELYVKARTLNRGARWYVVVVWPGMDLNKPLCHV